MALKIIIYSRRLSQFLREKVQGYPVANIFKIIRMAKILYDVT